MFAPFFQALRAEGVPVSPREYLVFLEGVAAGLATHAATAFYHLARTAMVKDERRLDRFDRAFGHAFRGLETLDIDRIMAALDLPPGWLDRLAGVNLKPEDRAAIDGRMVPMTLDGITRGIRGIA